VLSADHTKLVEFDKTFGSSDRIRSLLSETRNEDVNLDDLDSSSVPIQTIKSSTSGLSSKVQDARGEPSGSFKDNTRSLQSEGSSRSILKNAHKNTGRELGKRGATDDVESLLSLSSTKERESKKLGEELLELLSKPTAKERNLLERFRSADGYQVQEFCPKGTKDECKRNSRGAKACDKLHFKKIIAKHTEESLGDCSFLNTCFHMDSCKYVHYEVDSDDKVQLYEKRSKTKTSAAKPGTSNPKQASSRDGDHSLKTEQHPQNTSLEAKMISMNSFNSSNNSIVCAQSSSPISSDYVLTPEEQARIEIRNRKRFKTVLYPPQWIQCDLRYFDMSLLGKFSVVMADPPWDIHMELPYGTMSDDEMRKLNIPALQDEGVIFLWVTGRAMELGRECLALWGYERCDEIIWVKTNQLQRIIRTGRTGHWLNHGKEHCLVGIKGNPTEINRGLDCDIIVAEVRATSHKPDEIYGIIERLSPGTRKIELFGRAHNVQPNWITLGNQLNGVRLVEPSLIEAFKEQNLPYQTST